jgi:hypothetical protein
VAQEAAPDSGLAETTGQVVGGLAPAILAGTPTALATRAIRGVARRVSPQAQREAGREAVQDMMGQELSPEAGQRLSEAERLRKEIPGFEPSLGEATGSQALIAQQKRIEGQASGRDLDALTARRRGSEEAIDAFATRSGP